MKPIEKSKASALTDAAWRPALERLTLAPATTPSDLTDSDKLRSIRLKVFGRLAEEQPQSNL